MKKVWVVGNHRIIHGRYQMDKGYLIHEIKEKGKWVDLSKSFYPLFSQAEAAAKDLYSEIKNRNQLALF